MKTLLQTAWPLFSGIVLLMAGAGLLGTLLGVRANAEGFGTLTTGIIMSLYYGGFLAGTVLGPRMVQNVGHIRVFAALASLIAVTFLLHGLFVTPVVWGLARLATGFCFAGVYIVIESWMNDIATNKTRGKILSAYLLAFYSAMVVGQYLLNLAPPTQIDLFVVASILTSLALLPLSLSKRPAPEFSAPAAPIELKQIYKASPLGVVSLFLSGVAGGALFSIGPVYAAQSGMSVPEIANFMAMFIGGGICAQIPIGLLSDRMDRRRLITYVSLAACLVAASCFIFSSSLVLLNLLFFIMGVTALSVYPVGSAYTNDRLERGQYVGASALLLLTNGCGAFAGPFLVTLFMSIFGTGAYFPFIAMVYLCMFSFALHRAHIRPDVPPAQKQNA